MDNDGDGNVDAADTDCTLPAYFPGCQAGQTLRVYKSFDTPKAVPDNNMTGITSFVSVVNNIGTIASTSLLLNVTHTWIDDIDVTLISPSHASFDVTSDNGGSGDNYTSTVFQDSCSPITGGVPPFANCYAPEASLASLSGVFAQGLWQLKVVDDAVDGTGTLNNWALALCTAP
jgi:subtilisin-like proprotein convertase family protein